MGADIYLKSVSEKAYEQFKPLFDEACAGRKAGTKTQEDVDNVWEAMYPDEGYFRDSYNLTSLLWVLGLSWWRDIKYDEDGNLPIEQAEWFLEKLESNPITLDKVKEYINSTEIKNNKDDTPEQWCEYWQEKHNHLCQLLRKSIELDEPLSCSC